MSDPVAAKSTFLCMYMSNHPDTLVSYARHYGKVKEHVTSAKMTGIDTKAMSISYKTSSGEKSIRVPFDPPLSGYDEVKPRMIAMKAEAEEKLGMTKVPQITTFRLPFEIWKSSLLMASLVYVTFSPSVAPSWSSLYGPAEIIRSALPGETLKYIWMLMVATHALEDIYMFTLCRRHGTGFGVTLLYLAANLIWGFPIFVDFRQRVQNARIESILKGQ